ncbi:unnamed protein product [Fusarium graminearum]|nr:hypothetical protein FG05_11015 [Fusarium graminearum]CAG1973838.1 unnamed protein product [Fusarium graminearum]CAG1979954.1 unnamed protein product [Fusarium graminearum]CZS85606.1 unnamed protein product [Fusarium graminearum]VTO90333.1 unnamed protein product [Fusarium graminearum]
MVVDYFLRGRQFGRFLANHTDAHERYGFTDQDIRWISRYCPETGANDNEVEYEEKWFNPRSLSTARMHWRRAMKKLNDEAHESEIEAEDDNGEEAEVEADPHPSSPFHPRTQPSSPLDPGSTTIWNYTSVCSCPINRASASCSSLYPTCHQQSLSRS